MFAGSLYGPEDSQVSDCELSINLEEYSEAIKMLEPDKFKLVIFAVMTNIVTKASDESTDHFAQLQAIANQ